MPGRADESGQNAGKCVLHNKYIRIVRTVGAGHIAGGSALLPTRKHFYMEGEL